MMTIAIKLLASRNLEIKKQGGSSMGTKGRKNIKKPKQSKDKKKKK